MKDFINLTEAKYEDSDFINMEAELLKLLDFKLCRITYLDFYEIFAKKLSLDSEPYNFGLFMLY